MKQGKMLSAYSIIFIFLIITAILTWFVPPSAVVIEDGVRSIVYNAILTESGEVFTDVGVQAAGIWDILTAPIKGFSNSASIGIAILMAGIFLGMINYVGAMDAVIGCLLKKYTGTTLISILIFVFAMFGTAFGFWEEIPAFAVVIVPLFVLAG
ncbi:MAG: YfcC family protein, partial [Brevinema sp.]